jgi:Tfp pilus assembly protein PilZ
LTLNKAEKKSQKNDHCAMKELRKNSRKPCAKSAYFASQNKYYKGVIKNINRGGAFIETKAKFSTGQKLKLVAPGTKEYILLRGEIIHINQVGFGLKFKSILKKGKAGI